jgi:organic hydroperoxide reductase OsmC/OhrA
VRREDFEVETTGEIELEDKVLVIKRIDVRYRLRIPAEHHETAERVHGIYHRSCPVYRSLLGSIDMETHLELLPSD